MVVDHLTLWPEVVQADWGKATGVRIYDNQMGDADDANASTVLGEGSIVIHK